jgi:hypothetical protein
MGGDIVLWEYMSLTKFMYVTLNIFTLFLKLK